MTLLGEHHLLGARSGAKRPVEQGFKRTVLLQLWKD